MAKHRTSIPEKVAAKVRLLSDNTCCICRERENEIQIHHINEDSKDHSIENLAVLCPGCHDKTHKTGGFTRKFDPQLVTLYRDQWLKDVLWRRDEANKKDVERQVGKSRSEQPKAEPRNKIRHTQPAEFPYGYIESLPKFKSELLQQIKKQKSDGTTQDIVEAHDHCAKALIGILVTLATFYSPEHLKDQSPQEFFSEIISARNRFHCMTAEPDGPHTGGTISRILGGLSHIKDIENLIEAMVLGLYPLGSHDGIAREDWLRMWRDSDILQ